jgi:hypothetical protein
MPRPKALPNVVLVADSLWRHISKAHDREGLEAFALSPALQGQQDGSWIYMTVSDYRAAEANEKKAAGRRRHEISHAVGYKHPVVKEGMLPIVKHAFSVGFDCRATGGLRFFPAKGPQDVLGLEAESIQEWRRPGSQKVFYIGNPNDDPQRHRYKSPGP